MTNDSSTTSGNVLPDMEDEPSEKKTETGTTQRKSLPKSEYWLNIGVIVNGVFASLPYGVACDNMKIQSVPPPLLEGSEEQKAAREEFRSRRAISNQLVEHLQALMGKQQPGEDTLLPVLAVSLHRVKPKTAEEVKTAFSLPTGFSLTAVPTKVEAKRTEEEETKNGQKEETVEVKSKKPRK